MAGDPLAPHAGLTSVEIEHGVRAATALLDGTLRADVGVLSGLSPEEIDALGGVKE